MSHDGERCESPRWATPRLGKCSAGGRTPYRCCSPDHGSALYGLYKGGWLLYYLCLTVRYKQSWVGGPHP